ncbi:trypsin-like peptidase [Actinoplanes italicus]|uniref:Trypsin-like peptidase n=1 Tax=Actinoplanes italicus TaxID=113567 RepID=A0A2T0JZH2_9ACTN|nr:trypsin-like peptidase [Actinoplanes italicus]
MLWGGGRYPASVLETVPAFGGEDLWPFPDLALLAVADAPDHPCAWLSDRPVSLHTDLLAYGYPALYGEGRPGRTSISGRHRGTSDLLGGTFVRFTDDEVAAGMSGGPVLDLRTGAVCGLVKSTRKAGTALGGLVIPLNGMRAFPAELWRDVWRAHDRAHADGAWARARQELAEPTAGKPIGPALSPSDEVALLELLASIPVPGDLGEVFRRALYRPAIRPDDLVPLDVRDLMYELAERTLRPGELFGPVRLAADLGSTASGAMGERLRVWAAVVAAKLGQGSELDEWRARTPLASDDEPVIVVQLEPDALRPDRYRLTIWVHEGDVTSKLYLDDHAVYSAADARAEVSRHLTEQLRRLHGRGTVEFVLPTELFDEDFEELGTRRRSRLGRTNPVVIRDLERLQDPASWHEWELRWKQLKAGTASTEWLDCTDRSHPDQLDGRIRGHERIGVMALTRRLQGSTQEALEVALGAGVPAAVWRRDGCSEHTTAQPGNACVGGRFRDDFERRRSEHPHEPLPRLVKKLRNDAAAAPDSDECRNVVLLWDSPERLPEPFVPLTEP